MDSETPSLPTAATRLRGPWSAHLPVGLRSPVHPDLTQRPPGRAPISETAARALCLAVDEKKRSIQAARGHWSVENGNHYKRDASPWQEDRHRHRKPVAALNLALTRNVLLALIPFEQGQPLAHFFELYHRHPSRALRLILDSRPVL